MRKMLNLTIVAAIFSCTSLLAVNREVAAKDIIDTAVEAGSFKTLAAALNAADLVEPLKGKGPFTVFAPTDEAFAKLPEGTVETLLKPENRDRLTAILTYHVVPGHVQAKQVVTLKAAKTLSGQRVDINVSDDGVKVDKANVVKTDIACSNGIIHVIDSVILPSEDNIPATAVKAGEFKTLVAAVKAAGLAEVLAGKGPFTVFAPTDEAFAKLPAGTVESLLKEENRNKLIAILKYHVVAGRVFSDDALKAKKAETLQGQSVHISVAGKQARINKANLIATDIDAANGVIHVIDSVLLPPEKKKLDAADVRPMIRDAVSRGSRLYNRGHHSACAKIYHATAEKMMAEVEELPSPVVHRLASAVRKAERTHCPMQRAWTLRHSLDHAYMAMRPLD